jgi:DNA-binding GntR family transcriptional regulator
VYKFHADFWASDDDDGAAAELGSPDFVARQLVRGLYSGRFVPGQRLIEADLTREFGVSRGSVREALRRLAAEGVVSITMHCGACIRAFTKPEVINVLKVFEALLSLAAEQAAEQAADGSATTGIVRQIEALAKLDEKSDYFELVRRQNAVYSAIVELSGNRELARTIPGLNMRFVRSPYRSFSPRLTMNRLAELGAIVDAICAGDAAMAAAAARMHVLNGAAELKQLPDDAFALHSV